jgi:glycosyltransferase involved in cell wall biosynthesis
MEAMACKRPVIITAVPGIAADFAARDLLVTADAGDAEAMRSAIVRLIENPDIAASYAERGHAAVMREHTLEYVMLQLAKRLASLRTGAMEAVLDGLIATLNLVPTDAPAAAPDAPRKISAA